MTFFETEVQIRLHEIPHLAGSEMPFDDVPMAVAHQRIDIAMILEFFQKTSLILVSEI